jgi:hypothetical protein
MKFLYDELSKKHMDLITNSARKGLHKKFTCYTITAGP